MTIAGFKQRPILLPRGPSRRAKQGLRTQFGALCWRETDGEVQVLLVTSRRTKRWILPKGWPLHGMTPAKAAQAEAWEEAGAKGKVLPVCLGLYSYIKHQDRRDAVPCVVAVYPMKVVGTEKKYPEAHQRKRKWMTPKKASKIVAEPELRRMLKDFDPGGLPD